MPKILFLLFTFVAGMFPSAAHAEISSCYASITPTTTYTNSQATISVIVEQQSDGPANWIQVYIPPALPYVSASATGWTVSEQDQYVTFTGGQLQPYQTATFNITVETGSNPDGPWQFSTYVADNGIGDPNIGCDGSSGLNVLDGSSNVQISAITLRNITDSQATLSFSTNINATSQVVYGPTSSYGSTKTNGTATTTHSFTIDGLSKNTTYNFQITATSGSSSASSGNQTFTSAATSVNVTPTIIYISPTLGPTPTPTPDRVKPTITIQSLQSTPYKTPPTITGTVGDNVSVSSVEYSVDAGKTWNRIKEASGVNSNYATFSFIPSIDKSEKISIIVRARDSSSNIAISAPISFTLDTQGPEISSLTNFDKPFTASPMIRGRTIDASGEATIEYAIQSLHQSTISSFQPVDTTSFSGDTTSFTTQLPPLEDGNYTIQVKATDPLGNETIQQFNNVVIDRLAPQFGSHLLHLGPIVLQPTENSYLVPWGREVNVNLSLVGGPHTVVLTSESLSIPLQYNPATHLWQGILLFAHEGLHIIKGKATDGAGNVTETELFTVQVLPSSRISDIRNNPVQSTVTLLIKDKETGRFVPWDSSAYQQEHTQTYRNDKTISWLVPPGTYALLIDPQEEKYIRAQTTSFTVEQTTLITPQLTLKDNTHIPILKQLMHKVQRQLIVWNPYLAQTKIQNPDDDILSLPKDTVLNQYAGQQFSFVYANTWHPDIAAFLATLKKDTIVVFPHETQTVVDIFKARGDYPQTMIADPDGNLLITIPYSSKSILYDVSPNQTITLSK